MPDTLSTEPTTPPDYVRMIEMARGHYVAMVVHAAAHFGIADHLADGPKSAEELAGATRTHAPSLYRVMRTLSSLGVFTEDAQRRFRLTPLGETLKTGAPGAARSTIRTIAGDWFWKGMEQFPYSVETGKSGFEKAIGMPVFEYLAKHPEKASLFSETMVGVHGEEPATVAEAYDFSNVGVLMDVGGATGNMLAHILARHPKPRGILFDLPHVVKDAKSLIASRGLSDRIEIRSGSFFDAVPSGADAYLLSHVIHDWSEEQCVAILRNVHRAVPKNGRLLIVEMVLPPGNVFHPGKMLDMIMLVGPGGQERTEEEYAHLLEKSGFRLTRVVPTKSPVSVVEGVPA
ncbi:MAG TPA: methyltransferase [Candidatus Eisenbacteria bacterium]|nr:methyltransferase [Candidatus Eisenbacteria bacterium]